MYSESYGSQSCQGTRDVDVSQIDNETITTVGLIIDASSSMDSFERVMRECLQKFKNMLANSKSADEILVSYMTFNSNIYDNGYDFARNMNPHYNANGCTALYEAISTAAQHCKNYRNELQNAGVMPGSYLVIFSDGMDNSSNINAEMAKSIIEDLEESGVTVAFVSFGNAARNIAETIGVMQQNIHESSADERELRSIFAMLSRSSINASKNVSKSASNLATGKVEQDGFFV